VLAARGENRVAGETDFGAGVTSLATLRSRAGLAAGFHLAPRRLPLVKAPRCGAVGDFLSL